MSANNRSVIAMLDAVVASPLVNEGTKARAGDLITRIVMPNVSDRTRQFFDDAVSGKKNPWAWPNE